MRYNRDQKSIEQNLLEQRLIQLGRGIAGQVGAGTTELKRVQSKNYVYSLADKNKHKKRILARFRDFLGSFANKKSQRRGSLPIWVFSATTAAVVLGIYFCLVLPRYKTLTFNGKLGVLVSADIKDLVWEFEDGSRFDLRKGCKAKVEIANEIEVNVTLENGVLVCEIEGNGEREWSIRPADSSYRVVVLGTKFGVSWNNKTKIFDVKVEEGKVRVEGLHDTVGVHFEDGETELSSKYHLRINADNQPFINPDHNDGDLLAAFPDMIVEKISRPKPQSSEPMAEEVIAKLPSEKTREKRPGKAYARRNRSSVSRPVSAEKLSPSSAEVNIEKAGLSSMDTDELSLPTENEGPQTANIPIVPKLIQLIKEGKHIQALAESEKMGTTPLAWSDLERLWVLIDDARLVGLYKIAERALLTIRERFGKTNRARLAAYHIGKIYEENTNNILAAIGWYSTYLRESPNGNMAAQALAGKMRGYSKLGKMSAAKHAARLYLKYDHKLYRSKAKEILKM